MSQYILYGNGIHDDTPPLFRKCRKRKSISTEGLER